MASPAEDSSIANNPHAESCFCFHSVWNSGLLYSAAHTQCVRIFPPLKSHMTIVSGNILQHLVLFNIVKLTNKITHYRYFMQIFLLLCFHSLLSVIAINPFPYLLPFNSMAIIWAFILHFLCFKDQQYVLLKQFSFYILQHLKWLILIFPNLCQSILLAPPLLPDS